MVKRMRIQRKFKVNFPENKISNEKNLFHFFDLFVYVQSPPSSRTINAGTPGIY